MINRHESHRGTAWAVAALLIGLPHCAISIVWGLGGTWLLDTVGGSLEDQGRTGGVAALTVAWAAAVLKLVASMLPLIAVRAGGAVGSLARTLGWVQGAVLTLYGGVLTVVGLLVRVDVVNASPDADQSALAWHAYFWDPWFMVWGVLTLAAMIRSRQRR